jgi:dipeptidyl aminopeptidase/acylaminoacyl peptidase
MRFSFVFACLMLCSQIARPQSSYKQPAADVTAMVTARPTPFVSVNPQGSALLLTDYNPNPGIATLARPFVKLGGLRLDPVRNTRQRITEYVGATVQWLATEKSLPVTLPAYGQMSGIPLWSPNGEKIAFGMDTDQGTELWVADARTGKSARLGNFHINDVLGTPFQWMNDSERLFVRAIGANRGIVPQPSPVPVGPNTEETAGKVSAVMTYQDLLKTEFDERLFEYLATSQLMSVNAKTGKAVATGAPGLVLSYNWSPDERYLLVTQLRRPFSYRVQYNLFARKTEIWNAAGQAVRTVAEYGVTDEIPRQGVVSGPRGFDWQALHPARLLWMEALDGGDPKRKADFRDKVLWLEAPFTGTPTELTKTKYRCQGFEWTAIRNVALLSEYDRDRRWTDVWRFDFTQPERRDTMFSLSINDDYQSPGDPVYQQLPNGEYVIAQQGDWMYFSTPGATPEGSFPRLDRINLKTRAKETLFKAAPNTFEEFIAFAGNDYTTFITRHQSKSEPPNFFQHRMTDGTRRPLTRFADPAPQMTGVQKRLVKYKRKDSTPLSGTLYLPASYKPGDKLPLFMWAYPLEYSDAATAGQVRGSDNTFTFYRNDSPLFFVTQGYAVLMDATVPVVGDPETMNNTFVEQITSSGRAAIDYLDSLGLIDRQRVGVGGHSYGAFMTANLLAHSDDYAYGIARSGAYNRTLTPFGFQSERRSYWEARDIYTTLSPFTYANKINEPLLLIHGEADNNPGTHTMQSERLYQAIKGHGGTTRLVLLPHESHGYRARESVLHVLTEMFDWAKRYGTKSTPQK